MKSENNENVYKEGELHLNLKKRRNKPLQSEEQKNENSQTLNQLFEKLKNQYKRFEEVTDNLFTMEFSPSINITQNEFEKKNKILNQNNENYNSNLNAISMNNFANSNINQNYDPYEQKGQFLIQKEKNENNNYLMNKDKNKVDNNNVFPHSNDNNGGMNIKKSQNLKISKLENNEFGNEFDEFDNIKFNKIKIERNIPSDKKEEEEYEENNLTRKNNKIDELLDNELDFNENNLKKSSNKKINNNLMINNNIFEFHNEVENNNQRGNINLKSNQNNLKFQNKKNFNLDNNNKKKIKDDDELSEHNKKKRKVEDDINKFYLDGKKNEEDEFDEFESNREDNNHYLEEGIIKYDGIEDEKKNEMELEIELNLKKKKEEEERKKKELEEKRKKEEEEEEEEKKKKKKKKKKKEKKKKKKIKEERENEIENQLNLNEIKIENEEKKDDIKKFMRILPPSNNNENINIKNINEIKENEIKEIKESEIKEIKESEIKEINGNKIENNQIKNDNENNKSKSEIKENNENKNDNENNKSKSDIKENNENKNDINENSENNIKEIEEIKDRKIIHNNVITQINDDDIEIDLNDNSKKIIEENKEKQKSYISKINPRICEKIEKIVEKIYSFNQKEPNLQGIENFVHIDSLDVDEKKYSDCFSNYEELMEKEGINVKMKRKENFQKKKNYKDMHENPDLLIQIFSEISPSHPEIMKENEMKMNLNELLPQLETDFNEVILNENELLNDFNCPIGNFENIDSFIYKYSLFENYKLMDNSIKNINYWRPSLADGNSYYRIIIYGIFEYYITTKNLNELKKLICDIIQEDYITFYRDRNIDVDIVLKILKLILIFVENNEIEEAYNVLNKAFRLKNHFFDHTMIFYLRHVYFIYTKKVFNKLEKHNKINKNDLYNLDAIEELGIEPYFFLIHFLPYLYNINFKIFYIDNNQICGIFNFIDEKAEDNIFMMIGYFYSNYFNLYYNINDNLKKIIQKNHFKLKKLIAKSENKEKCKECKKETEQLIFLEKKFIICEKCLRVHINEILKNRTRNFEKEEFNGLEYYNGPIHLKDEYYIDNYDMIELYGENMKNKLYENESYNCVSCDRLINDKQYNLKCGCKYCKKCFIKQLEIITQNNMFLNRYERETYEKKNVFVVKFLTLMKCYNYIHQMKKN